MMAGMSRVARELIIIRYVTVSDSFPPSLSVMTPAADAVGQIKQIIAHSRSMRMSLPSE